MAIYQSTNTVCFMLPSGFAVSGATRCGNALGRQDHKAAHMAAIVGPSLAACVSTMAGLTLLAVHKQWGGLYTTEKNVIDVVATILPILVVYVVVDGVESALTGIFKATGKQRYGGPIVLFSYYVVGMLLFYVFIFSYHHLLQGD